MAETMLLMNPQRSREVHQQPFSVPRPESSSNVQVLAWLILYFNCLSLAWKITLDLDKSNLSITATLLTLISEISAVAAVLLIIRVDNGQQNPLAHQTRVLVISLTVGMANALHAFHTLEHFTREQISVCYCISLKVVTHRPPLVGQAARG